MAGAFYGTYTDLSEAKDQPKKIRIDLFESATYDMRHSFMDV